MRRIMAPSSYLPLAGNIMVFAMILWFIIQSHPQRELQLLPLLIGLTIRLVSYCVYHVHFRLFKTVHLSGKTLFAEDCPTKLNVPMWIAFPS